MISVLVRGDLASLDLDDGTKLRVPKKFGVVHDPTGITLNKCDIYLTKYTVSTKPVGAIPKGMAKFVDAYLGRGTPRVRVAVEIPKGPWHRLGVVKTVHYVRRNQDDTERDGLFYHHFDGSEGPWSYTFTDKDPTTVLLESRCMHAFKLELPDGCIVNDRGFVWP